MTHDLLKVTSHRTGAVRLYVDGKRVSREVFDSYRSIGTFFTESTDKVRRYLAVGVRRW
jgi:hypothetical protein